MTLEETGVLFLHALIRVKDAAEERLSNGFADPQEV